VPEQEYPPPRPPGGFRRPAPRDPRGPEGSHGGGYYGEDPPPWAGLRPVRPARPDYPRGPSPGWPGPPGPVGPSEFAGPADFAEHPDPTEPSGEEDVPPWAGPDADDDDDAPRARLRTQGSRTQGSRTQGSRTQGSRIQGGRAQRAAARRRRRWLITIAGLVVVAGSVTAVALLRGGPPPASVVPGGLITTFQPGELRTVPNACGTVPAATVQRYLPGQAKVASPLAIDGAAESACDWTIDQPTVYRLLQLNLLAYPPSALASGDGSATDAAIDAYATTLQNLQDPPKDSADPRAAVTSLGGLGNEALSAVQVFRRGGAVTDVATVVIRYHNVIVTATLDGLAHSSTGDYGPVSVSDLSAAALAFAQAAEATLH
jgi:hypothetical protein